MEGDCMKCLLSSDSSNPRTKKGRSGAQINTIFSPLEILACLKQFYKERGHQWPDVRDEFNKQIPKKTTSNLRRGGGGRGGGGM